MYLIRKAYDFIGHFNIVANLRNIYIAIIKLHYAEEYNIFMQIITIFIIFVFFAHNIMKGVVKKDTQRYDKTAS